VTKVRGSQILVGLVVVSLFAATPAPAQSVAGSQLSGVVRDASGGAVPGAEVLVTKTDTGQTRSTQTAHDGAYVFPNLPVGPYELRVTLQGFNTYVQSGIVLQVSTNPTINVTLNVGTQGETVTVVSNATMVETQSTGVGQVIDNQRVKELPLNGRQVTELIFLSGLAASAPPADLNTNKNFPTTTISVAGGQANGISFIMDGATHNDPFNNLNLPTPFPDAIREFKVETSALPARYGHHAASTVNVVTQSGSNKVTVDAFEFLRNYRFNARNYFAPARDSLNRNQFGGTVGAPLVKDKLFFFGGYQGRIERSNPVDALAYVPTQAMRNGDFTAFTSPSCNGGRQVNLGGPFVDNRVDPSRLNGVALNFLQYVPVATDPCGALRYGIPNNNNEHQGIAKFDYTINSQQHTFVRYFYAVYENPATYDGENVLTLSRAGQRNTAHSLALGHNWALSPTTFNALHVTFNRTLNDRSLPEYFTPTELGSRITSPYPGYMGVTVTGNGFSVGFGAVNPGYFHSKSFQVADDLDFIRGKHQFSIGANWIHTSIETSNNRPTNGAFTFNGQSTGLSLADFMVGSISGGFLQGNPVYDYDNHDYIAAYVQDSWRVRPNLLLNLGLRWEPFRPIQNDYGWVSHFDKTAFDQGTRSQVYPQAPPGLTFAGDPGFPGNGTSFGKTWNFAPRVGMVWTPGGDGRTSIRAAWGVFYDAPHLFFNTRFSNNPPWGAQITISNPPGGFTDPYLGYPGGNPFPALNTAWPTAAFPAFGVYVNTPLNMQPTSLQQWNLSVQREVGGWLLAASYLGNHSSHLWRVLELNPAVYGPGATTGNTNQRRVLFRQNPDTGRFYGTIAQLDDTGRGNYNALFLQVQRRLNQNLSVLTNWTLSKCMSDPATTEITGPTVVDPNNPDLDYSYCAADRRHVVNASVVWTTPRFGNGVLSTLFSDWQISPLVRWQTGSRSSVTTGVDNALNGTPPAPANFGGGQRAVQVLDNPYGNGTPDNYLVRAAFTSPAPGTYSTLPPFSIVNPSTLQNDIAVSRTFKIGDNQSVQFRWEIFNVLNHTNFNGPVTALNSPSFGKIQSAGDPRIMQFGLKFRFN
jgi:carboxypeptidase family protein